MEKGWPLEYSHTLTDQIGGQLDAGFVLTALYEDHHPPEWNDPVSNTCRSTSPPAPSIEP